jgi:hypothetical protein
MISKKFVELYQQYQSTREDQTLNVLKTMATQYLRFKDNKVDENSLKLYLSQLEKKEIKQNGMLITRKNLN